MTTKKSDSLAFQIKVDVQAFCHKSNKNSVPESTEPTVPRITRKASNQLLFAGPHPISEYMDNISRVGQVIINEELHCHTECTKNRCKHAFVVDLTKQPTCKRGRKTAL